MGSERDEELAHAAIAVAMAYDELCECLHQVAVEHAAGGMTAHEAVAAQEHQKLLNEKAQRALLAWREVTRG